MTIAELHGKLSPDQPGGVHDRMEDLLTSDVFGTMKYAGWQYGFIHWLLKAQPAPIQPALPLINAFIHINKITHIEYSFWPKLKNNREPDLALLFCFDLYKPLLILIEAKYFSGTSDWEMSEQDNSSILTGNQLADQVLGIENMTDVEVLQWFQSSMDIEKLDISDGLRKIHLFITTHTKIPSKDYNHSCKKISNQWPIHSYWLSWTLLADCLRDHIEKAEGGVAALLFDLFSLLQRKRLIPFRGFGQEPFQIFPEVPSFWSEKWWNLKLEHFDQYPAFWKDFYLKLHPIGSLPDGIFWKGK